VRSLAAFVLLGVLLTPIVAAPDVSQGLPGTRWSLRGRASIRVRAVGQRNSTTTRVRDGRVSFGADTLTLQEEKVGLGVVGGVWSRERADPLAFSGTLYTGTLEPLRAELERDLGRSLRREIGGSAGVSLVEESAAIDGTLVPDRQRLRLRLRPRFTGVLRARGREYPLRLRFKLRLRGRPATD